MDTGTFSLDKEIEKMVLDVEGEDASEPSSQNRESSTGKHQRFEYVSFDHEVDQSRSSTAPQEHKTVRVEIGRASLSGQTPIELDPVIRLDQTSDEPVNILIDGEVAALGELLVVDGKLAIRVTQRLEDAG